jgi:hypothetical protein
VEDHNAGARAHRTGTLILSAAMVVIGVALVATAIGVGAGVLSGRIILGVLFLFAGSARLYLLFRT